MAPPFQEADFDIIFGKGISKEGDIINLGYQYGIIQKSGTWFSYNDMQLGQGKENTKIFLLENPQLASEIEKKILKAANLPNLENDFQDERELPNN